jgi:predicted ATP-grasp superfamily ATP-dependent carboligase
VAGRAAQEPRGALLLGSDYRALGVARSLGRRGVPVCALKEPGEPLAALSRYVDRSFHWPQGAGDEERVAHLEALAAREGLAGWALFPTADETAALVARHHERLAGPFVHTSPSWEQVRWAYDKRLTHELADAVGVAAPRTARPLTPAEAAASDVPFPAVLKPAVKESFNRLTAAKAWRVDDREELAARFAEGAEMVPADVLMVQELVPGGGEAQFSYAALCRDGEPLAALTARRTRQYPADFGRASTYVETVSCPEIVEPSLRLLRRIGWNGLIEVEYKRDPRDGVMKLLDMNPRVWGWHTLCGRAGVDFPYLLWLLVSGRPIPAASAREGVGWLRFTTDTPTALKELAARRLQPREYLRSLRRPRESAIFAWDDPLPGASELPLLALLLGKRVLRGEGV